MPLCVPPLVRTVLTKELGPAAARRLLNQAGEPTVLHSFNAAFRSCHLNPSGCCAEEPSSRTVRNNLGPAAMAKLVLCCLTSRPLTKPTPRPCLTSASRAREWYHGPQFANGAWEGISKNMTQSAGHWARSAIPIIKACRLVGLKN